MTMELLFKYLIKLETRQNEILKFYKSELEQVIR